MDYPSNSNKSKEVDQTPGTTKKVESVVSGSVVVRKPSLGKRFAGTFFGGDLKGVFGFVVLDVLVPAAKDMVADAVSQGFERMLYGEVRSTSRRPGSRPGMGRSGYTSYNRYSQVGAREDPRSLSRRSRATFNFDEIVLESRGEALQVLDGMYDLLRKYEIVTVSDLYDLVGVSGAFTDEKYGWTEINTADVRRVRDGYLLVLPKPEPLD